jgi:acyl-CoA thioester hydrolase
MGIVYHMNYIRWFEIGRTELMREIGIVYSELEQNGYYLPVTQIYCHFLLPIKYDDLLQIHTTLVYLRHASMRFAYEVMNETGTIVLAEGYSVHAFTNREGKIIRAPQGIGKKITE